MVLLAPSSILTPEPPPMYLSLFANVLLWFSTGGVCQTYTHSNSRLLHKMSRRISLISSFRASWFGAATVLLELSLLSWQVRINNFLILSVFYMLHTVLLYHQASILVLPGDWKCRTWKCRNWKCSKIYMNASDLIYNFFPATRLGPSFSRSCNFQPCDSILRVPSRAFSSL